ncbi:MAG: LytR/AlgR family response regulator transcription factor [Gemmatimonadaceae bacterium]
MIRALVVDDEPLARRGIRVRLERAGGVEVIGECGTGRDAVSAIRDLAPDLVFLDVHMPGLDGFGVVERVGVERMPPVVFVTTYDAHALRAFDVHALDYLLKPIDDERFDTAVERARRRIAERQESALGRRLAAALAELKVGAPAPRESRILIKDRGRVVILNEADVDWIEAEGDYVRVHAGGRGHLLRETMSAMEARLDPSHFARIHRSAIVNVERIRELRPHPNREYTIVLRDGTQLKLSRGYRDALKGHFGHEL